MSYIRSDDAALYYEEYGAGQNLVLLPGIFGTIELDWRRFIPDLARNFHTIAIDTRGHGRTNNPSGTLSPDQVLSDLRTLFDTLEIERAFLCTTGHMGILQVMFAIEEPERILGLILHSPRLSRFQAVALSPPFPEDVLQRAHAAANGPEGWEALRHGTAQLFQLIEEQVVPTLRALRIPVLATIDDEADAEEEADINLLVGMLSDCTIGRLHDGGRRISTVQKEEFIRTVVAFSSRICGAQTNI